MMTFNVFVFFLLLFFFPLACGLFSTPAREILLLEELFISTNGEEWAFLDNVSFYGSKWNFTRLSNGDFASDPCFESWQGIACVKSEYSSNEGNYSVSGIVLDHYNLQGKFPSYLLGLSRLETLSLWGNYLSGPFIIEESLKSLVLLDIEQNYLTGTLPSALFDMTSLTTLSISYNLLEGNISSDIANLEKLVSLYLWGNQLSGTVPSDIGSLRNLERINIGVNFFTKSLPNSFSMLSNLKLFMCGGNYLTGSIPAFLSNLTSLEYLVLYSNLLTGTLPDSFLRLTNAQWILLNQNLISGTLPSSYGQLQNLSLFWVGENPLSGTIPASITNLTKMDTLVLHSCMFSGTLPNELHQLSNLAFVFLNSNYLSGSLRSEVSYFSKMRLININDNSFTGTIPSEVGSFSDLQVLDMGKNQLSGRIPSEVGSMDKLIYLGLESNFLTGTVPPVSTHELLAFFLQNNLLTGGVRDTFWQPQNVSLLHFDVSSNLFSGAVSSSLFLMPNLTTVAFSKNCFSGGIPLEICGAQSLRVLSMDGLGVAEGCRHSEKSPFSSSVTLHNTMDGSLPECIWSLSKLESLHVAGNGFSGSIPESVSSSIININLAHNYFSGSIPTELQERDSLTVLDLSFNRIKGSFRHANVTSPSAMIRLEVNRLSGPLRSQSLAATNHLDILKGNVFACDDIPQNDKDSDVYSCGSKEFDVAFFCWLSIGLLVLFCIPLYMLVDKYWRQHSNERENSSDETPLSFSYDINEKNLGTKLRMFLKNHKLYTSYVCDLPLQESDDELLYVRDFCVSFGLISRYLMVLALACVLAVLPLLVLKAVDSRQGEKYATLTHSYSWMYSLAYMSGDFPAILVIIAWVAVVVLFAWLMLSVESRFIANSLQHHARRRVVSNDDAFVRNLSRAHTLSSLLSHMSEKYVLTQNGWKMVGLVLLNIVIVLLANILYIKRLSNGNNSVLLQLTQVSFAFFKVLYSIFFVPWLCRPIKDLKRAIWIRIRIHVFNSIWIPVLATLRSSPSCFEGLFNPSHELESQYSFQECINPVYDPDSGSTVCLGFATHTVNVEPLTPPFLYHYQCASTLLTSYIPVFMYVYMFQLTLPFVLFVLSFFEYNSFHKWLRMKLPGMWWPHFWLKACENKMSFDDEDSVKRDMKGIATPRRMLNIKTVLSQVMHHSCVLLTFGLCSPHLCLAVICSICVTSDMLSYMIGRFVHYRLNSLVQDRQLVISSKGKNDNQSMREVLSMVKTDNALCSLSEQLGDKTIFVKSCFVPVFTTSAAFMCFICFNMAGDRGGWRQSMWVPVVFLTLCVLFGLMRRCIRHHLYLSTRKKNPDIFQGDDAGVELEPNIS